MAADEILVAVGRAPNVEGLGLEAAGVAYTKNGVTVDDRLRTSNRRIYAAGDVASRSSSPTPPTPWRGSSSRTPCSSAARRPATW